MARELTRAKLAEQSILTRFRKELWAPFLHAIDRYSLIEQGDRIGVCISGGKDSMLMAKLLQLYTRVSELDFSCRFIVMDPGYDQVNRAKVEENAKLLDIPIQVFESDVFEASETVSADRSTPCYFCARMRRGFLYDRARELGCNKIALGHHRNDVIETTIMSMCYGAQLQTMPPKLWARNFDDMQLIRPMYGISEESILSWVHENVLEFIACACRMTSEDRGEAHRSKRAETKELVQYMKTINPAVEENIFNAVHAVDLDTFPGFKRAGIRYTIEDVYAERGVGKRGMMDPSEST